jgi:hypothetical protein
MGGCERCLLVFCLFMSGANAQPRSDSTPELSVLVRSEGMEDQDSTRAKLLAGGNVFSKVWIGVPGERKYLLRSAIAADATALAKLEKSASETSGRASLLVDSTTFTESLPQLLGWTDVRRAGPTTSAQRFASDYATYVEAVLRGSSRNLHAWPKWKLERVQAALAVAGDAPLSLEEYQLHPDGNGAIVATCVYSAGGKGKHAEFVFWSGHRPSMSGSEIATFGAAHQWASDVSISWCPTFAAIAFRLAGLSDDLLGKLKAEQQAAFKRAEGVGQGWKSDAELEATFGEAAPYMKMVRQIGIEMDRLNARYPGLKNWGASSSGQKFEDANTIRQREYQEQRSAERRRDSCQWFYFYGNDPVGFSSCR